MAHSKSAKKRMRQNEKERQQNKSVKSSMRTSIKAVEQAIEDGDREQAEKAMSVAAKKLDKAGRLNIIHKNQASRRRSRLQKRVNEVEKKK